MSKAYDSLRDYRRNTAAYWLRSARKSLRAARKIDSKDNVFLSSAVRELMLYAKWRSAAERADW